MEAPVVVGLIAGAVSLIVALLGQIFNPIAQRKLENQKSELQGQIEGQKAALQAIIENQKAELQKQIEDAKAESADRNSAKAARRDYEYEALKRLYTQVEPFFLQLYEAVDSCYSRISALARTSRQHHLGTGHDSWIDQPGYFLRSTAYRLIVPAVHFRIIQRRITFVDFKLDQTLRLRYLLLRSLFRSYGDAFDFAGLSPKLDYGPVWEGREHLLMNPVSYPQGLVAGDLDNTVEHLIHTQNDSTQPLTFGAFETEVRAIGNPQLADPDTGRKVEDLEELISLYCAFSPETRPILARMLLAQAGLCFLVMLTYRGETSVDILRTGLEGFCADNEMRKDLCWDAGASLGAIDIVRPYLNSCIDHIATAP